jgi:putative ATP-dependent endonuclease of OLD family
LLDLDAGRYHGGWGRVRNALKQINTVKPGTYTKEKIDKLPKWNDDHAFPTLVDPDFPEGRGPIQSLELQGVFFSHPVDLDLMMMAAYPDPYGVESAEPGELAEPDQETIVSVLGKSHSNEGLLPEDVLALFDVYHDRFDLGSKPAAHLAALADLSDEQLLQGLPDVLARLVDYVRVSLSGLPE